MTDARRIIIQDVAFGAGFDVLIVPKPDGLSREFTSYREARGYAAGLAEGRGWPITDTTGRSDHAG